MVKLNRKEAEIKLRKLFGINRFYDEQWSAVDRILKGERVLMIERTGFGKSLCYQFPAVLFPGITVVFSPLLALTRDQVKNLRHRGINAAYVNCELIIPNCTTPSDMRQGWSISLTKWQSGI